MNNRDLCHKFAYGATSGKGSNLFIDGDIIYSYGYHFALAKRVTNIEGQEVVLYNSRRYSNSTSKQQSYLRSALYQPLIFCPHPNESPEYNFKYFEDEIKGALSSGIGSVNAKRRERAKLEAMQMFELAKDYANVFGIKLPKTIINLSNANDFDAYTKVLIKEKQEQEKKAKEAQKKELQALQERLTEWKNFERQSVYTGSTGFDFLRFNTEKKRFETTQSIQIPEAIAQNFFHQINAVRKGKKFCDSVKSCNLALLDYQVKEITKDFIVIGCHKIQWDEILFWAKKLNWEL